MPSRLVSALEFGRHHRVSKLREMIRDLEGEPVEGLARSMNSQDPDWSIAVEIVRSFESPKWIPMLTYVEFHKLPDQPFPFWRVVAYSEYAEGRVQHREKCFPEDEFFKFWEAR